MFISVRRLELLFLLIVHTRLDKFVFMENFTTACEVDRFCKRIL